MNSSFCLWLAEIEDGLWRMIQGVFRFTCHRLPEWIYRMMLDTIGPATIRLIRVMVVLGLWLAVVFGPVASAVKINFSFWGTVGCVAWLVLAISGSIWGQYCLVKKRRAAAIA